MVGSALTKKLSATHLFDHASPRKHSTLNKRVSPLSFNHFEDVIRQGYVRIRGKNFGFWSRRYMVLRKASSRGPCRLDKYTDKKLFKSEQPPLKTAILEDIASIERIVNVEGTKTFGLHFDKQPSRFIACDTEDELEDWFHDLVDAWCKARERGISRSNSESDDAKPDTSTLYPVNLLPVARTLIRGECYMQVTEESVSLYDAPEAPKLKLLQWPLDCILRYGKDSSKFTLEVGPHCLTGEGNFIFLTMQGSEIYSNLRRLVKAKVANHQQICRRSKERTLSAGLPRVSSAARLRKSFTDGCLFVPGEIYDDALLINLDRAEAGLPPTPEDEELMPHEGFNFIIGS